MGVVWDAHGVVEGSEWLTADIAGNAAESELVAVRTRALAGRRLSPAQ